MQKEYTLEEFKKVWTAGTDAEMCDGAGKWTLIKFSKSPSSFPFAQGPWRFVETKTMTKKKHAKHSDVGNKTGVIPVGTVVWKKAYDASWTSMADRYENGIYLVKMVVLEEGVVPKEARLGYSKYPVLRKCRAPSVCVIQTYKLSNDKLLPTPDGVKIVSAHDWKTEWKQGTIVKSNQWNDAPDYTCTYGIHFYRTLTEAKAH